MKNRIKKFYNEHEDAVLHYISVALVGGACLVVINKIIDGKDIARVARWMYDDGTMDVRVTTKNGNQTFYHWDTIEK